MTIYVDSAMIPARVGRHNSRWCHLMGDDLDPTELHTFADRIGLKRAWFQAGKRLGRPGEPDPVGDHYDVTEGMRRAAVAAGAVEIDRDGFVALMRQRRRVESADGGGDVTAPELPCHCRCAGCLRDHRGEAGGG